MSSSYESNKPGSPIPGIVVGIILMFGGMYLYDQKVGESVFSPLADAGLPLNPWKTVAVIGVFLILVPVINIFFINPLKEAIQSRNSELEKTFGEVEGLRAEMSELKSDFEKRIAATEAQAREEIQAQIREAQELRKTLTAEASARSEEMIRKAQEEIEAQKAKALLDIRVQVASLSIGAAEKLLLANMDTEKNRKLVDEFLETAEVRN